MIDFLAGAFFVFIMFLLPYVPYVFFGVIMSSFFSKNGDTLLDKILVIFLSVLGVVVVGVSIWTTIVAFKVVL